jgi:hypothetical protein
MKGGKCIWQSRWNRAQRLWLAGGSGAAVGPGRVTPAVNQQHMDKENQDERVETTLGRRLPMRPDAYSRERSAPPRVGLPLHGLSTYGRKRLLADAGYPERRL